MISSDVNVASSLCIFFKPAAALAGAFLSFFWHGMHLLEVGHVSWKKIL